MMKKIQLTPYTACKNAGDNKEIAVRQFYGISKVGHDSIAFDLGSDIPTLSMSVKSSHATLVSGSRMTATTWNGQIEEYFERTHSTCYTYVSDDFTGYEMTEAEFREFLCLFSTFERDSTKNGGRMKVRLKRESQEMRNWLEADSADSP